MESVVQQRMDAKGDLLKKLAHLHFVSELLYILRCEEATNKVSKIANCAHCKLGATATPPLLLRCSCMTSSLVAPLLGMSTVHAISLKMTTEV